VDDISIPVAFELIKSQSSIAISKRAKLKRASLVTKNELMRDMLQVCVQISCCFALSCSIPGLHPKKT